MLNKKIILLTLLFIKVIMSNGQNLVPNPSFENHSQCPDGGGQVDYAIPWYGVTSLGSSDYFSECATYAAFKVPGPSAYFQFSHTGIAHSGIYAIDLDYSNVREYLQVQLNTPLLTGKCYYIEFYSNLMNTSRFGVNNIASYLSINSLSTTGTGSLLDVNPQIQNYGNKVITDTLNWIKISGIFTAGGGEEYITIGNFKDDNNTDTSIVHVNPNGYNSAYYYIDDVLVTEITSSFKPTWSYKDTTINAGDSVFIGTRTGSLNCTWYKSGNIIADDVPGLYVKPTGTTTYVVKEKLPCSPERFDTLVVTVNGGLGIRSNNLLKSEIYPNPSSGVFNIDIPNSTVDISVYNTLRMLVNVVKSVKGKVALNLSNEPHGIYFVKITDSFSNESISKKIIIQ
jgi:hypothetical protein